MYQVMVQDCSCSLAAAVDEILQISGITRPNSSNDRLVLCPNVEINCNEYNYDTFSEVW